MATDSRTLSVVIEAVDNASKTINGVMKSVDNLSTNVQDLAKKSLIPLAAVFASTTAEIYSSINAFAEESLVIARLEGAISNVTADKSQVSGLTKEFENMAISFQNVSIFGHEALMGTEAMFLNLGMGTTEVKKATDASIQLASAFDKDLGTAAYAVGLALEHPSEALGRLTRVGVFFTNEQKDILTSLTETGNKAEAQAIIYDMLAKASGRTGDIMGKSFGGQLKILQNNIDELNSSIGEGLIVTLGNLFGGMDNLNKKVIELNKWMEQQPAVVSGISVALLGLALTFGILVVIATAALAGVSAALVGLIAIVVAIIGFFIGYVITNFQTMVNKIGESFTLWQQIFINLGTFLTTFFTNLWLTITTFFTNAFNSFIKFFTIDVPYAIGFMIGWVTTAIPVFVEQLIQWFADLPARLLTIFQNVYIAISTKLIEIMAWITKEVSTWPTRIQTFIASLPAVITAIFENVKVAVLGKMSELWKGVTDWWQKIKDIFTELGNMISDTLGKVGLGIEAGKKGFITRQYGGYVPSTGLAMLHEGEFVVSNDMLAGRSAIPSSVQQSFNQPITINPTMSGEPDWDLLGYKLAWVLRNAR